MDFSDLTELGINGLEWDDLGGMDLGCNGLFESCRPDGQVDVPVHLPTPKCSEPIIPPILRKRRFFSVKTPKIAEKTPTAQSLVASLM